MIEVELRLALHITCESALIEKPLLRLLALEMKRIPVWTLLHILSIARLIEPPQDDGAQVAKIVRPGARPASDFEWRDRDVVGRIFPQLADMGFALSSGNAMYWVFEALSDKPSSDSSTSAIWTNASNAKRAESRETRRSSSVWRGLPSRSPTTAEQRNVQRLLRVRVVALKLERANRKFSAQIELHALERRPMNDTAFEFEWRDSVPAPVSNHFYVLVACQQRTEIRK